MSRRSAKKFDYGEGIYYFILKKGFRSEIVIKRLSLLKAVQAFKYYLNTNAGEPEWLGKWDGNKFIETNFQKLVKDELKPSIA